MPLFVLWAPVYGGHCGRDGGFAYVCHGLPLAEADMGIVTAVPNLPTSEISAEPQHGTWWQVDCTVPLPSHRGSNFFSSDLLSLPAVNTLESKSFHFRVPYSPS